MRCFTIGRLFEEGKLVSYKLYDANASKVLGIIPKENVIYRVRQGIQVVGLKVTNDGKATHVHESFNMSKIDIINGKGNPIEPTGMWNLLGISGYAENRMYRLVNSKAIEKKATLDEFNALVEDGKVNGAKKSKRGGIIIYKQCKYREYWAEEENNSSK